MSTTVLERKTKNRGVATRRVATAPRFDRQYTADELLAFPSDWHYELIEGYLRPLMMPTGGAHGSCAALFTTFATIYVIENKLGYVFAAETGFLLAEDPDVVKAPDFAFVTKDRMPPLTDKYAKVASDLVLEVRSPSDRKAGTEEKIEEWLRYGVRYVLDLDPVKETLHVHRPGAEPTMLTKADSFIAEDILPGFALPLSKVFINYDE